MPGQAGIELNGIQRVGRVGVGVENGLAERACAAVVDVGDNIDGGHQPGFKLLRVAEDPSVGLSFLSPRRTAGLETGGEERFDDRLVHLHDAANPSGYVKTMVCWCGGDM